MLTGEELTKRFNTVKQKIEENDKQIIEKELKLKQLKEEEESLLSDLQKLGYNNLDVAKQAYVTMSKELEDKLSVLEQKLSQIDTTVPTNVTTGTVPTVTVSTNAAGGTNVTAIPKTL